MFYHMLPLDSHCCAIATLVLRPLQVALLAVKPLHMVTMTADDQIVLEKQ